MIRKDRFVALGLYFSTSLIYFRITLLPQDIASISYYVPGYHTGPDPPNIRINSLDSFNVSSRTTIMATKLEKEVLLRVPRPNLVPEGSIPMMPMLTIGGKKITLIVLRPGAVVQLKPKDGAKVVYGMHILLLRITEGADICS